MKNFVETYSKSLHNCLIYLHYRPELKGSQSIFRGFLAKNSQNKRILGAHTVALAWLDKAMNKDV
jgi:hypothetical protein